MDGVYAAILLELSAQGLTCGGIDPTLLLPDPPSAEEIARLRNLGRQNYQIYGADPVSFSTGNYVLNVDLFSLPGLGDQSIDFNLYYNGQDERNDRFGYGWSFPYNPPSRSTTAMIR